MKPLLLISLLALAGCATTGPGADSAPMDVSGADITRKVMDNGDTVEEYHMGGQLRMVKVTPARGAPFYMYDRDGDGRMDSDKNGTKPVYWKLYSW